MNPIIPESSDAYLIFAVFADLVKRDRNVAIDRHRVNGTLAVRFTAGPLDCHSIHPAAVEGHRLAGRGAIPDIYDDSWERVAEYHSKEYPA